MLKIMADFIYGLFKWKVKSNTLHYGIQYSMLSCILHILALVVHLCAVHIENLHTDCCIHTLYYNSMLF